MSRAYTVNRSASTAARKEKRRIPAEKSYGAAVDLGTTRIRVSLRDRGKKLRPAYRSMLNPQASFGADVLTRLTAAAESAARAREIGQLAWDAVGDALRELASAEALDPRRIGRITIVGNTAMLSLLTGKGHGLLLEPSNWTRKIDCAPRNGRLRPISWGMADDAFIEVVPPLAGFVGSDLMAGILATGLTAGPPCALLIDFGANTEIALWDGELLRVTSTAGGPAFEGRHLSCGMDAGPGAISRVKDAGPEGCVPEVIGGGEPKGVCGSGLVDLIACLVRTGLVDRKGNFARSVGREGFRLLPGRTDLILKKGDIDVFQRAKAAIGAATACLMEDAGARPEDLRRVCVGGDFGEGLDAENARSVGLLPETEAGRVELCGNTALAGCEMMLLSPGPWEPPGGEKARLLNMSGEQAFEERFFENLLLRPLVYGKPAKGERPPGEAAVCPPGRTGKNG